MSSPEQRRARPTTDRLTRHLAKLDRAQRAALNRGDYATAQRVEAQRARAYGLGR